MYWEEKIEYLKKEFPQKEFSFPFHDWVNIMKKMEDRFLKKEDMNYHFSSWGNQIKDKVMITTIEWKNLLTALASLPDSSNYWVVIVLDQSSLGKHYLYDCSIKSIPSLVSLQNNSFFIVDKKYNWFVNFNLTEGMGFDIFKSGNAVTPFDGLQHSL